MTRARGRNRATDGVARAEEIMRRLQTAGFLSVTQLTAHLGVSDMTVRRDLRRLAEAGEVRVVHGGVSLPHATLRTADFTSRAERNANAKQQIARRAVDLIDPSHTVTVDSGTTAFEIAVALPDTFRGTVITHSVPVLQQMLHMPQARVVCLGGELLIDHQSLVGSSGTDALKRLRADVAFIGAVAVSTRGVFVATEHELPIKLGSMDIADKVVVLADHGKLEATAPVFLSALGSVDMLITDAVPPLPLARALADADVDVITTAPTQGLRSPREMG